MEFLAALATGLAVMLFVIYFARRQRSRPEIVRIRRLADEPAPVRRGVYCGALMEQDGRWYGIANLNTIEDRERLAPAARPFDYDGETEPARRARRGARWTPAAPLS